MGTTSKDTRPEYKSPIEHMHRGECWERRSIYLPGEILQLTRKRLYSRTIWQIPALDESVDG